MATETATEIYWSTFKEILKENGADIPELQVLADHVDELQKTDISTPFMNYVWRVWWEGQHDEKNTYSSVVVKIAPAAAKMLGQAPPKRLQLDCDCLRLFNSVCPHSAPNIYVCIGKEDFYIAIMEDVKDYEQLQLCMAKGSVDCDVFKKMGYTLAQLHKATHVSKLSEEAFKKMDQDYCNKELAAMAENSHFMISMNEEFCRNRHTIPEAAMPDAIAAWQDEELKNQFVKARKIYNERKECLIHADFNVQNILMKNGDIKVIDAETARVGPSGEDLGTNLGCFVIGYHFEKYLAQNGEGSEKKLHLERANNMVDACTIFVSTYFENMTCSVGDRKEYVEEVMSYIAAKTAGVIFNICHFFGPLVPQIAVDEVYIAVQKTGFQLMRNFEKVRDMEHFIDITNMKKLT